HLEQVGTQRGGGARGRQQALGGLYEQGVLLRLGKLRDVAVAERVVVADQAPGRVHLRYQVLGQVYAVRAAARGAPVVGDGYRLPEPVDVRQRKGYLEALLLHDRAVPRGERRTHVRLLAEEGLAADGPVEPQVVEVALDQVTGADRGQGQLVQAEVAVVHVGPQGGDVLGRVDGDRAPRVAAAVRRDRDRDDPGKPAGVPPHRAPGWHETVGQLVAAGRAAADRLVVGADDQQFQVAGLPALGHQHVDGQGLAVEVVTAVPARLVGLRVEADRGRRAGGALGDEMHAPAGHRVAG